MSIWDQIAAAWHDAQPHPHNPTLSVGDYATAVKLATRSKFGGHASPQEAGAFWTEFSTLNDRLATEGQRPFTPEEYTQVLDKTAPHSFAYHGRPPTMDEIVRHRDAEPSTIAKYYGDLPDQLYPQVPASQMAKYVQLADEPALQQIGRRPTKGEAAKFALGGFNFAGIGDFYRAMVAGPAPSGVSELRLPGQPYPDRETGSGGLERRIRDAGPPLSGDRRAPSLPTPPPSAPQSGGNETGVTE